jgi:hypothetical protein
MSNLIRRPQRGVHQEPPVGRRSIALAPAPASPAPRSLSRTRPRPSSPASSPRPSTPSATSTSTAARADRRLAGEAHSRFDGNFPGFRPFEPRIGVKSSRYNNGLHANSRSRSKRELFCRNRELFLANREFIPPNGNSAYRRGCRADSGTMRVIRKKASTGMAATYHAFMAICGTAVQLVSGV